jgi:hypothetical protein
MSANTAFSTTNSKLTLFISKQTLTNNLVTSDLSSTEYPLVQYDPIQLYRDNINKLTYIGITECNSSRNGYLTSTSFNTFSNKLSTIIPGTNIYATPSGTTNPTVSLAISQTVDMCNQSISRLLSEDFETNIDIRQAGNKRIYNSGTSMIISPSGELILKPSSNVSITSNVVMNSKTVDMCGGVITGISNENFSKEMDIRLKGTQLIYTTNGSNMSIDASGILNIRSVMNMNSNKLNMNSGDIQGINGEYFSSDVNIYQGLTKNIIYTNANDMTIYPDGILYIGSPIDMCGNEITNILYENYKTNIDIRQNGTPRIYTTALNDMTINAAGKLTLAPVGNITISSAMDIQNDVSMNARTLDMESGFITGISNENYKTNIDIRQDGSKRIYTIGNRMTFDTSGLTILSDVSMNGKTLDMVSGFITGISNENYKTNIDIRQDGSKRIYTTGNRMTFDTSGLTILSDVSMNGKTLDMVSGFITGISNENYKTNIDIRQDGSKRIYTTGNRMTFDTSGLTILSDVSMNGNTIMDISGLYSISGEILRIDASNISFTYGTKTHVVIDNSGIILNDISSSNTGTVLTFDTTTNRVNYYPLYDTSSFLIDLSCGILAGGTTIPFTMKISHIGNTVTMRIPDVSGSLNSSNTFPYIATQPAIDVKYRPTSNISFPALLYDGVDIINGKALLRNDGYMRFYTEVGNVPPPTLWNNSVPIGLVSQSFTYHTF